jgi:ribosome biogenesis GTPase
LDNGDTFLCTRRSRLKKIGEKVLVGDRVSLEEGEAIAAILPRTTILDRPPVANAEQILLVFSLEEPPLDAWQLSRFLLKAESTGLAISLALNKCDLLLPQQQQIWRERINKWGYNPLFISVQTEQGISELLRELKEKITILAGPSGVGKSSLINYLIPQVEQRVGAVSGKLQKGRHTTRHVELFPLPQGGLVADTPGFNQPDLSCSVVELVQYFPEIRERLGEDFCHFNNCLHRHEPNCLVRGDWERYEHYLKFLGETLTRVEALEKRPDNEARLKLKIKNAGQAEYEPKLDSKRYRRQSRKHKRQSLEGIDMQEED